MAHFGLGVQELHHRKEIIHHRFSTAQRLPKNPINFPNIFRGCGGALKTVIVITEVADVGVIAKPIVVSAR